MFREAEVCLQTLFGRADQRIELGDLGLRKTSQVSGSTPASTSRREADGLEGLLHEQSAKRASRAREPEERGPETTPSPCRGGHLRRWEATAMGSTFEKTVPRKSYRAPSVLRFRRVMRLTRSRASLGLDCGPAGRALQAAPRMLKVSQMAAGLREDSDVVGGAREVEP